MSEPHCKTQSEIVDLELHWNETYLKTPTTSLGWHEEQPGPSLELIEECSLAKDDLIVNAGAGTTTLVERLLEEGYSNIVINDIAAAPLTEMKNSLSKWKNASLEFVVDDLVRSKHLIKLKDVTLWHDRAVLHFFTKETEQHAYFALLKKVIKPGGFVIFAEFSLQGAKKCCGLPVVNYSSEMLSGKLGADFEMLRSFEYAYTQPSGGTREYIYTLFKRSK